MPLNQSLPLSTVCQTLAASVLFISLGIAGCTTASTSTQPSVGAALPEVSRDSTATKPLHGITDPIDDWFAEARTLVGNALNVDLSFVEASVVDADDIANHARHSLLGAVSHDIENHQFAAKLVDDMLIAQTASVLAIYTPPTKAILMHRENLADYLDAQQSPEMRKAAVQALMIHELVHAADDLRFEAFDHYGVSYQEVFAKSTIIEGHAQWHTRKICKVAGCSAAFNAMTDYMFDVDTVADPALRYIQSRNYKNLEFVYREGERFIDQLMKRPGGQQLVDLAFEKPPQDSIQIIDPTSFPNRQREQRNLALSDAIKNSKKPWDAREKGLLRRNVLAAAAFSVNPDAREPIVEFYTSKVLAAAKHEYYDRNSDVAIPVSVVALQTSDSATAKRTATLIYDSTTRTYNGLTGETISLDNWTTDNHATTVKDKLLGDVSVDIFTANGIMNNDLVGSRYPVEVVTATSGDYIVHIDGRFKGTPELINLATTLLINLQQ